MHKRLGAALLLFLILACGAPDDGDRVLSLAMEQDVITLDPHAHDDSVTHSVLANVYEALVTFDGAMHLVPALAARWENPSDHLWRFHLRRGVAFHDGRPLTAEDVKFSLERASRTKTGHYLSSVKNVTVLDAHTLELETLGPEPVLLNKLALIGIVPAGTPAGAPTAVGTGAYRVVSYRKGDALALAANGSWWRGAPAIRRAEVKVLADPASRARALARREIHLAREVSEKDLNGAAARHARFLSEAGLHVFFLGASLEKPGPLRDARVRRAIFWALDPRELIRESGLAGTPSDQLVPATIFGHLARRESGRPQVDRARALLEEAGYGDGLALTLDMPKHSAGTVGKALAAQLGRVGIRLEVTGWEWRDFSGRLDRRESPFYNVGWACYGDASDLLDAMLHTRRPPAYGAANFGGYSSPEVDAAIERAGRSLDPSVRLVELQRAMERSLEDLPLIPLYQRRRTYGVDERVRFQPRQNGQVLLSELAWAR